MSTTSTPAIRKPRNNPVVREFDLDQRRDFSHTAVKAALLVAMLFFSALPATTVWWPRAYSVSELQRAGSAASTQPSAAA